MENQTKSLGKKNERSIHLNMKNNNFKNFIKIDDKEDTSLTPFDYSIFKVAESLG